MNGKNTTSSNWLYLLKTESFLNKQYRFPKCKCSDRLGKYPPHMPLWFPWIALRRPGWACTQRKSFMGVVSVVPKLEDPKLHTFPSEQTNSTRSLTRPSLWYIHWCGICICTKIETCSQSFWQRTSQLTYPQNLKHLLSTKFDSLMAQSFICVVAVAFFVRLAFCFTHPSSWFYRSGASFLALPVMAGFPMLELWHRRPAASGLAKSDSK